MTIEDVIAKLEKREDGCWVWPKPGQEGYGTAYVNGKSRAVHIHVYTHFHGPYESGMELDHTCRNRACANPDHLEPVHPIENRRRGSQARRAGFPSSAPPLDAPYPRTRTYRFTLEDRQILDSLSREMGLDQTSVIRVAIRSLRDYWKRRCDEQK